jgi:hypothetical protein
MDARGLDESALVTGARRSTMDELAPSTLEADNVIVGALFMRRGLRLEPLIHGALTVRARRTLARRFHLDIVGMPS